MDDKLPKKIGETPEFYEKLEELLEHDLSKISEHLEHIDPKALSSLFNNLDNPLLRVYALSWLDDAKAHTGIMRRNLNNLFRLIKEVSEPD